MAGREVDSLMRANNELRCALIAAEKLLSGGDDELTKKAALICAKMRLPVDSSSTVKGVKTFSITYSVVFGTRNA